MNHDRVEIYEDKSGEYRWRVRAANGEIVATGEGYSTAKDAHRGFTDAACAVANAFGRVGNGGNGARS